MVGINSKVPDPNEYQNGAFNNQEEENLNAITLGALVAQSLEDFLKQAGPAAGSLAIGIIEKVINGKMSIIEAFGLKPEQIEGVYGSAVNLYENARYEEANGIFKLLMMLDPEEPKYILGLAAGLMMLKKLPEAIGVYIAASQIDPDNPIPYFHRAECNIQLDEFIPAKKSLLTALKLINKLKTAKDQSDQENASGRFVDMEELIKITLKSIEPDVLKDDPMKYEINQEAAERAGQKTFQNDTMQSFNPKSKKSEDVDNASKQTPPIEETTKNVENQQRAVKEEIKKNAIESNDQLE